MAIAVKLDDLLHQRRMTLTELAEQVDITLANLSILKTGKARAIRFSTLEAICQALRCQPGDLIEYRAFTGSASCPHRYNWGAEADSRDSGSLSMRSATPGWWRSATIDSSLCFNRRMATFITGPCK